MVAVSWSVSSLWMTLRNRRLRPSAACPDPVAQSHALSGAGAYRATVSNRPVASNPGRLGSTTGLSGPLWRSEGRGIIGVACGDDSPVFRSVDASTTVAKDLNVRVPAETGRGSGLGVRWDERRGHTPIQG